MNKKEVTLPDELKDGGELSFDDFDDFEAMGYYSEWTGLKPLPGFHLVEYEDGCIGIEKD